MNLYFWTNINSLRHKPTHASTLQTAHRATHVNGIKQLFKSFFFVSSSSSYCSRARSLSLVSFLMSMYSINKIKDSTLTLYLHVSVLLNRSIAQKWTVPIFRSKEEEEVATTTIETDVVMRQKRAVECAWARIIILLKSIWIWMCMANLNIIFIQSSHLDDTLFLALCPYAHCARAFVSEKLSFSFRTDYCLYVREIGKKREQR